MTLLVIGILSGACFCGETLIIFVHRRGAQIGTGVGKLATEVENGPGRLLQIIHALFFVRQLGGVCSRTIKTNIFPSASDPTAAAPPAAPISLSLFALSDV